MMTRLRLLFGFFACLLSGCAIHHVDEEAPLLQVQVPLHFSESAAGEVLPDDWNYSWWETFNDQDLNRLIESGSEENFELQQYAARIRQGTALARQAGARLYPSLDLDAGYQSEWDGETLVDESRDRTDTSNVGFLLNWELDVWGRLASLERSAELAAQATIEDWQGARLLLSAAIAETYFEIQEQRRQLEVISEQIKTNEDLLRLISLRFGQGQSSIVDVLQQRAVLEATQTRVPETEARIGQLEYSLAVLLGRPPGKDDHVTSSRLRRPPPLPAVGIPAQLLTHRFDLKAAQRSVLALDYDVGAAVAEQLPTLTIGGGVNWTGDPGLADEVTAVFARLAAPLFDAGERRNEVIFRQARLDEALAAYSDLYLSALLEVESALLEERKRQEQLVLLEKQLATAQKLLTEARNRFSQGLTDYLPVFTSLAIVQNLERDVVSARRGVLSARVSLHRALGGPMLNPESHVLWSSADE